MLEQPGGQLVDARAAAGAGVVPRGVEHHVLHDQLAPALEQVGQADLAGRAGRTGSPSRPAPWAGGGGRRSARPGRGGTASRGRAAPREPRATARARRCRAGSSGPPGSGSSQGRPAAVVRTQPRRQANCRVVRPNQRSVGPSSTMPSRPQTACDFTLSRSVRARTRWWPAAAAGVEQRPGGARHQTPALEVRVQVPADLHLVGRTAGVLQRQQQDRADRAVEVDSPSTVGTSAQSPSGAASRSPTACQRSRRLRASSTSVTAARGCAPSQRMTSQRE